MAGRIRIIVVHQPLIYDQCMSAKTGRDPLHATRAVTGPVTSE